MCVVDFSILTMRSISTKEPPFMALQKLSSNKMTKLFVIMEKSVSKSLKRKLRYKGRSKMLNTFNGSVQDTQHGQKLMKLLRKPNILMKTQPHVK